MDVIILVTSCIKRRELPLVTRLLQATVHEPILIFIFQAMNISKFLLWKLYGS